eukprot:1117363_1
MMCFLHSLCYTLLLLLFSRGVLAQTRKLQVVYTPDRWADGDTTWWLEQLDASGTATLLATGEGHPFNNPPIWATPVRFEVDENACLQYRIRDMYGDGGGYVSVYFDSDGDGDLDADSTTGELVASYTFDSDAESDKYRGGGGGGDVGYSTHLFQNGVAPLGTVCTFDSIPKPDTGCHEEMAVDIIFVVDTSSDLLRYCQQDYYWDTIIDLVEHYVPRTDLQIAIVTYGTDAANLHDYVPFVYRPFSDPRSGVPTATDLKECGSNLGVWWFQGLKPALQSFRRTQCIGGGHSTISALDMAITMFVEKYGTMHAPERRQYIIMMTDSNIEVDEYKNKYPDPCYSWKQTLEANAIEFILLNAADTVSPHLSCLLSRDENLILLDSFGQLEDAYELVEDLVCSSEIHLAVSEIFIDDANNRFWFEIVNLGRPFNVSELEFTGNLFTGSVDDNTEIPQGDILVIGDMRDSTDNPCDIYGGNCASSDCNFDCSNYYAVDFDGTATLSSFTLSINDRYGSSIAVSSVNALDIEPGYSYELPNIYLDFTNMTNWRESCYRYGSPGTFGTEYCYDSLCDPVKCKYNGHTSATCHGSSSTTVTEGDSNDFIGEWTFYTSSIGCNCVGAPSNYYYDEFGTRSCILVPEVTYCYAYVTQPDAHLVDVTWTASPYETVTGHNIYYGDNGHESGLDDSHQGTTITFLEYETKPVRMTVSGTDPKDGSMVESEEIICTYGFAPTRRPTRPGETWDPTQTPTLSPTPVTTPPTKAPTFPSTPPTKAPTFAGCGSSLRLDLMIIMDSSGSVYNRETGEDPFKYWNNELDFVKTIVNKSLPGDSRVGAINFSGCGSSYDKTTCRYTAGQLVRLWGLLDFGMPNDQEALYNRFDQIDSNDFIGGKTWTDEALGIALAEFKANSTAGRKRMILLLTDGEPYPRTDTYDHDPCYRKWNNDTKQFYLLHESDNLLALRELDVTILTVGIGLSSQFIHQFFECLVTDFNEHFWEASDFSALDSLVESIAAIVCSVRIELIINEVGLLSGCDGYVTNGTDSNELIWFIELYNAGAGVSLDGFEFQGMINYQITSTEYVDQGEYWVISTFDMTTMDQTEAGCRGCGQDLLIDPMCADTTMDNDYWDLKLLDKSGNEIEFVERNPNSFPPVDKCHTHELQWEDWDNSLGPNWEESCYVFGTPQDPNQEPCPCRPKKCQSRGDLVSYCDDGEDRFGNTVTKCVCSSNYLSSGGVCVPVYAPECCFAWEEDCANNNMLLDWCAPPTEVVGYLVYKDGVQLGDMLDRNITSLMVDNAVCGSQTPKTNYSVETVFQTNPQIKSAKTFCPPLPPTPAPTQSPTQNPTQPTEDPTMAPTTQEPTTGAPSLSPTPFTCYSLTVLVRDGYDGYVASDPYPPAVIDIGGVYTLAPSTVNDTKWMWEKPNPISANDVIEYATMNKTIGWTIKSGFTYLVYPDIDDANELPPYSQSVASGVWTNWTDTFTGRELQLMLVCELPPSWTTQHPTPTPSYTTPPPDANCTTIYVTADDEPDDARELIVDAPLKVQSPFRDGRGWWQSDDRHYTVQWSDRMDRWILIDNFEWKTYIAPLSLNDQAEPLSDTKVSWVYMADPTITYNTKIECEYITPNTTTPAPTVFEPCSFPDSILNRWHLGALEHWDKCYYTTYSDGTTHDVIEKECLDTIKAQYTGTNLIGDVYVFVGAIKEDDPNYAYIGAYGHVSVLETTTDSLTKAQQTSQHYPRDTWWYNYPGVAFGFSDSETIRLAGGGCDIYDLDSTPNKRLCWHMMDGATGGWRAGSVQDLNYATDYHKVIYYKECNVTEITTPAPTLGVCETIEVVQSTHPNLIVGTVLNDYGVVNDYKYSWQDAPPNTNDFELGWLGVIDSWVMDTVSDDGKTWAYADPNYDPTFPPFDIVTTWVNRDDPSDTIDLELTCDPQYTGTAAPSPPPQDLCDCLNVTAPGLSAIEGFYNYSGYANNQNDGGVFIRYDGMHVYYDTDLETWMITENGAYFEVTSFTPHATEPTQIPPLDVWLTILDRGQTTTGVTAQVKFECSTVCPAPELCPPYDIWRYVDSELIYTSFTQIGFPKTPTENENQPDFVNGEEFERDFDEFLYSRRHDESTIQLSISDYIIPGNTTLQRGAYPPAAIEIIYDSLDPKVYRDSNTVGLWFQLTDAYGSTYLDLDGVFVEAYADCPTCTVSPNSMTPVPCNVSSVDDETGFNWVKCEELAIPDDWFVTTGTNELEVYAKLYLEDGPPSAAIHTSNIVNLTLAERIEAEGIDYPGIFGEFAMSPRYATDEVRLDLWLQSDEIWNIAHPDFRARYAQAWWLSITFDNSILEYIEFNPDEETWGSIRTLYTVDQSNGNGLIEIWGSKIGQLLNTNGPNVTVGHFVFEVIEGTTDGTYSNALSFSTLSMSGDNGYSIATDVPGPMADIYGWSTLEASLVVIPDDPIDILVEVDTNHLWNSAFITGITTRIPFPIYVAYHFDIRTATSLTCHVDDADRLSFVPTVDVSTAMCFATATSAHTTPGILDMGITADGIDDTHTINVWVPETPFDIEPWNTGTRTVQYSLDEINAPWRAVGDVHYESLPVYVYCTWTNGVDQTDRISVNEFLAAAEWVIVNDDTKLEIVHDYHFTNNQRYLMRGLDAGTDVVVTLTLASKSRDFGSVTMQVGQSLVEIEGYGGILVTHSEFLDAFQVVNVDGSITNVLTDLKLYLANEGDIGSVHPFILLEDGVLMDLTDDENVEYESTYPDYLELIDVDKSNAQNMDEAGAYVEVTPQAEQVKWQELVHWNWINPNSIAGLTRSRGEGCIPGALNKTEVLSVNATLSCDTPLITRVEDPAEYIWGIPTECELIVKVYWSDGAVTDMSTDNRTVYTIVEPSNDLLYLNQTNIVRANTSCPINTEFDVQNPDCYGFDKVAVTFRNYPKLANWTDDVTIEVVIFDRLRLKAFPYPDYDNSTWDPVSDPANKLNYFYECAPDYQMAELRIWGNLTNGEDRELTPRTDIVLTETDDTTIFLQSDERLVTGQAVGTSDVTATLAGRQVSDERDNYTSNLVDFAVADHLINLDTIELYTFIDRDHVFEDLINTRELLKLDATFSDGVIIPDILRKMVDDDLWPTTAISEVFTFTSTDPEVVSVDEDGFVEILDNWWRGVNITVQSQCSDAEAAELIYPNLKPDYWDVDVEEPYTETGLQFQNQRENETFLYNIYINATNGTLLSFSIRLWWHYHLFIEDDVWPQCYTSGDWRGLMFSWNIDTVRGELRLAAVSSAGSSTSSAVQHVATCSMRVRQAESNISMVVGQVLEISYLDAAANTINHVYNQPIVAGDGYQQINNGQTIKHVFPENVQRRYEKEQSLVYDCSASTGDECLFEGDGCSCCTEPVFGDVNFDCKHTAFDAQATTYYFIDATSAYGFSTILHMDLALSQRIAMDQSLDYLQDDINECAYGALNNPCPQGLEDTWYALQVSTGKFLYLNLSRRNQSLVQNARVVKGIAPMFIQEYPNIFRYATDLDATVFFELRGINEANVPGFTGTDALAIGEVIPWSSQPGVLGTHTINDSIIIKGEYINNTYWTFETTEFDWEDGDCFEMAILYETYSEDDGIIHTYDASEYVEPTKDPANPVNCTQIDREYAFRGSEYYGDVFLEFTELCLVETTNPPTHNPTPAPTSSPTVEWTGPEIVDCRYEDHGTAILAFFNMDTNRAGFEGSPFSCLATWNPVSFNDIEGVTEDSRCIWKDFSTMRIELGYEFGMRPTYADQSYRLILAGGNVRNYAEDSPPATGYCIVYPMFNPPPVFASIIGPTHLGPCDDLRLLGSPTTGQAAPMTWEWQLPDRSLQNGCVLGSAAIPNDKEILYIPNNCLTSSESEEEYVFVLTATNHYLVNFNYDASQSKTERAIVMYPTASKKPTVELLVPTVVNITTEQDLIVPAFVRADSGGSCDEDDLVFDIDQFSFEWETLEYFTDILGQDGYNPFGSLWSDERDPNDGQNHINFDNFVLIPLTDDLASTKSSSTLIVPGSNFEAGKYYGFKLTVTYKGSGQTNVAYVGVVVNLPIPYPRPSQMYQSIRQGKDITVDINNLYDFYDQVNVASLYGIEWDCVDEELNSVLSDASSFDGLESITINELNADLSVGNVYNCSAHLFSTQRNTLDMTWGRQESYYVFEYVIDDSDWLINNNGSFKMISVELTTNIGTINRNKRVVISATITDDSWRPDDRPAGYDWDNGYTFSWSNFGENSNMQDDVYGISIIEHLEYEHNTGTINFVVDDEVNRFIFDGQKYGFQLKVTADELAGGQVYGGYGQIELIANRGPNGGQCVVELFSAASMIYRVECYGWTDEYMELPLEYNFMLLNFCWNDNVCPGQLICDKTSEYDMGVCTLTTVGPVQNYLREWTQGTVHYFTLRHTKWGGKKFILRTFVRDYTGFVTTFDTAFKVAEDDSFTNRDDMFNPMFAQMQASQEVRGTTAFGQYITAVDTLLDRWPGNNRTDIQREIDELYYSNFNNGNNRLFDRFYDYQKIYSSFLNEIMFDYTQFNDPRLKEITKESPSMNVAMRSMKMIRDMIRYYDTKRGGLEEKMIPRDLSVYELLSMTWPGDAALQQEDLNTMTVKWNNLKKWYFNWVLMINEQGLNERLVDETHYNVSYDGLLVLSGWETNSKLFSDDSDCGGDLVDLAPDYYVSYFGGERVDYVKCELVSFNGGILTPTAVSEYMSSPIIYWKLRGFLKDGTEIPAGGSGRRRMVEFGACSPFLYQVPHNPDTGLMNYGDRMDTTSKQSFIPWSVCKTVLELSNDTEANPALSSADSQAPTAKDCYVLTHDEQKTVCACNSNYTLLSVEEELYYPKFMATLNRYNPDWSWDGLMHSVGAMLWILILLFFFTFAFYVLPSYDKHKALLAVKKGLPKSQREGAYFQTAEGKVFRAARINMNNMSWCQVYGEVYKIRLRNDHLCLWWCCDDPGSNVSHFIKVLLSVLYCLLFLFQLAWFYGKEHETAFPDTLFAFLIAFETILPIWCCAWCISKIRPHEFTDEEIDELVNDQMPIITKDQKWEDEYESDVEHGGAEEMDEGDEAGGFFAIPEIHESPPERQNNWDILRVYTDIDEEMEFLEENYMPDENKWHKKKRKTYPLEKVGYEPMESDEESLSSLESHEERRGFEGQNLPSHYGQARDAAKLGFIPVNEEEEYDPIASAMLNENRKEQLKQKRKDRHEREGSISSKLSSLFRRDASEDSKGQKKKKKKEKKRRRSSLMQLLSFGSKKDVIDDPG